MPQETADSYLEQRQRMRRKLRIVWLILVTAWLAVSMYVLKPLLKHIQANRRAEQFGQEYAEQMQALWHSASPSPKQQAK